MSTILERLQQKQAGTVKAPASGVSKKEQQKTLSTPYADAAQGNTILERIRNKGLEAAQPNLYAQAKNNLLMRRNDSLRGNGARTWADDTQTGTTGTKQPAMSYSQMQNQLAQLQAEQKNLETNSTYSPIALAALYDNIPTQEQWEAEQQQKRTDLQGQIDALQGNIQKEDALRSNRLGRVQNNRTMYADQLAEAQQQKAEAEAKPEIDRRGPTPGKNVRAEHEEQLAEARSNRDTNKMWERMQQIDQELEQLGKDWRTYGENQRNTAIMEAFNPDTDFGPEELSREEYEQRKEALEREREALEKEYRIIKGEGPYEGTKARQLNYAVERESAIPGSNYIVLFGMPDFQELSKAGERKGGGTISRMEALYNYINDIDGAQEEYDSQELRTLNPEDAKFKLMQADEIAVFNYIYNTQGEKAAKEFLEWVEMPINQQFYTGEKAATEEWVGKDAGRKILTGLGTTLAQPYRVGRSIEAVAQDFWRNQKGKPIDAYSAAHRFLRLVQDARAKTTEDMGDFGRWLTEVGYSAGDSAMNMLTATGVAAALGLEGDALLQTANKMGAWLMSSEVFASTIAEAKDKGYSDEGAFFLGMTRAGMSVLTETIGGENVIKLIKENPESFLRCLFIAMAPEGIEEVGEDIGNEIVNAMIDNSYGTQESLVGNLFRKYQEQGKYNPYLMTALSVLWEEFKSFNAGALSSFGRSGVQTNSYQDALQHNAAALNTDKSTVIGIMKDLKITDPADLAQFIEASGAQDADTFRAMMKQVSEETGNAEAKIHGTGENEQAQENQSADALAAMRENTPTTPGTDPRAAERAQMEEDQQRREDMQNDFITPPVEGAERVPTPGVNPRAERDTQLQEETQRRQERELFDQGEGIAPPVEGYTPARISDDLKNDLRSRLENNNGGITNEEQSDFGEQQRNDAERAGGEGLDNEGRAVSVGMDAGNAESERRNYFQNLVREKVTAAALDVDNGSTTATTDVLDDSRFEEGTPEFNAKEKAIAAGLDPVFISGTIQIGDGVNAKKARAYIKGNRVILQADAGVTAEQLLDHELYHQEAQKNQRLNEIIRTALANNMTQQELDDLVTQYITAYDGVYDFSKMTKEEIKRICQEEIFADMYAGIDNTGKQELRDTTQKAYGEAQTMQQQNAEAERETTGPPEGRYSINAQFKDDVQEWYDNTKPDQRSTSPGYFKVGTTSNALQSIGARTDNIYIRKYKIGTIMEDHPDVDIDVIKNVPEILENPILIMKSRTHPDSIVLLSDIKAKNGDTVMAALQLTPQPGGNAEAEFSLVTSAYDRTDASIRNLIDNSELLYLDPDKKRTNNWLMQLRVQFPSRQPPFGSIGNITYAADGVKITGKTLKELGGIVDKNEKKTAKPGQASVEVPGSYKALEQEYKRRYDAYMAASDANDTEFDYRGESAWMQDAEKKIGRERAAQLVAEEATPGKEDTTVPMDQVERELLEVGEARTETENGKYRLLIRKQKNGDYMATVYRDGNEQAARRFSSPEEAAAFAAEYMKGQQKAFEDAAEEAESSPEQAPEIPTELPDGNEDHREYVRQKKNKTAKLSNTALRDRILRTQGQIDSLKRMDRNPATRLTEQQRNHLEDLQETLDILVDESNGRKQRAKDRRGKEQDKKKQQTESRNKATESARAARSDLLKLWRTQDGQKASTAQVIDNALEEMQKNGRITEENREKLINYLLDAGAEAVEADSTFAEIRKDLKGRRVYVSEHDKADFPDWKAFRQRAFSAGLWITNDQNDKGADVLNEEMAEVYGQNLFPSDVAAQDALENLVEKMERGKPAKETLSDAIDHWAELEHTTREEILNDFSEKTDEILRTFAEKAKLEVQIKDRTADMLQEERARFEERLAKQSQRHRETQIRDKVLRGLKRLQSLKGRADPETKQAVEQVLKDIDIHAKTMSIERLEDLQALQRAYEAAREAAGWKSEAEPGNWIPNKFIEERLSALTKKHLNDMEIDDVIDLGRVVLALENTIRNNGKMIGDEFDANVAEIAKEARTDVENSKGSKGGFLQKWFAEEHLSPRRFLDMLGGWKDGAMKKLSQSLENGQTRALDFQRRATQTFDPFLSKKENREWLKTASGKKAKWTEYAAVDGMTFSGPSFKSIELTPMMKVSLYLHSLNNDNLRHIQNGGLVIPNKDLYIKGDIKNAYEKGVRVKMEPEVVRSIVKDLTPQEKLFARYMQKVFNGVSKDAINEVSLQLDGFERAGVSNYMPIESSRNFLKSDVQAEAREGTVEGIGSIANERIGGTNPMVLDDASNVLERQIDKVSRYYGYAIPIRNFQAVYNHIFSGENGESYSTSMKETIGSKWGAGAKQYIDKMLSDIQGGGKSKNDPLSRALSTLKGNLAGSTLTANFSVAFSQVASYPGAAQAVGWDGLAHGLTAGRVDPKLIEKYSPLYWYRNQGNSTQELGDYTKEKRMEQKMPWLMNLIQKMDSATIRRLWAAAEYRVAKDNPNLSKGTQEEIDAGQSEFYKKVAEVFNRAVYDTQPNYTDMERAQILRSDSDVTKFLTMYKTVPLQYYGMMAEAAGKLQAAQKSGDKAQTKNAQKYALDTFGGILAANSVYVVMKALFKRLRKKDKDYRDEDGNLTFGSVTKQLGKDLAEVYAGSIIGGAEAISLVTYLAKGGTYHAPEMSALSYIEDAAGAMRKIITAMDSEDPRAIAGAIKDGAKEISMGFGFPANNIESYFLSIIRLAFPKAVMEYENMFGGTFKGDLKGMDTKAVGIAAGLILSNRTGQRFPEGVSKELARLYEAGEKEAIPTDIPDSFTYNDKEVEIKDRGAYSDAWGSTVGDSLEELLGSDYYQKASDETKGKIVDHLYDYATVQARRTADPEYSVTGNSTYGWTAKAEEAVANGATLAETITTMIACSECKGEKDENGETISGSVKAEKIAYINGLDTPDSHKDALFMATVYSDKDSREKLEAVEDIGISQHEAITALNDMSGMAADKDENGKSIANSKRDKISTYIDGMDISDSQKDQLFILMGYKETSLKYTPWHGYQIPASTGGSGGSSRGSGGSSKGSGSGSSRGSGGSGKTSKLKLPSATTNVKVPSVKSGTTGKAAKGAGIQTSTATDLIKIIDEIYGGNALAALADDRRGKVKGKTKVDFRL